MKQDLPDGVVTFLFTDVEGSTRLFEKAPDLMLEALRQHDEAIDLFTPGPPLPVLVDHPRHSQRPES